MGATYQLGRAWHVRANAGPGETRPRRERINLPGSRVEGVELAATATPYADVRVSGHLTLSQARRLVDAPADPTSLSPDALGRLALSYRPAAGINGIVDAVYTGHAYSLDDNNVFVPLPPSLALSVRVGYRLLFPAGRWLETYVRVDNVTDAVIVPQLGRPEAGRMAQGGIGQLLTRLVAFRVSPHRNTLSRHVVAALPRRAYPPVG